MDANIFFSLKSMPVPKLVDGFSVDTVILEEEMEKYTGGIRLSSTDFSNTDETMLRKYVPFYNDDYYQRVKELTDRYESIKGPCAMSIESVEELSYHMSAIYQVMYFHYVLGKKHNMNNNFPNLCCGPSARNVALSLIDAGYVNTGYVWSAREAGHSYPVLPFVFEKENICGTLIADPTYDQYSFDNATRNMRNAVLLRLGSEWEYKNPADGKDMYPGTISAIDSLRQSGFLDIRGYYDGKNFFEKAFANPIKLQIEDKLE